MSKPTIYLWFQSDVKVGGWPTYTCHLAHGLEANGYDVHILRAQHCKKVRRVPFGRGRSIYNIPFAEAKQMVQGQPAIVVCGAPKQAEFTTMLCQQGAHIITHDPTEFRGTVLDEALQAAPTVMAVRTSIVARLRERGCAAEYVPHPYEPCGIGRGHAVAPWAQRPTHAVAISRVDWDKRTHTIIEANRLLPAERRVHIHGFINRIYAYHKLDADYVGWREDYYGAFGQEHLAEGAGIASTARVMVDLTVIKGDGGGTQYSFLEALDAGCALVVHREWRTDVASENVLDDVSYEAGTGEELRDVLLTAQPPSEAAVRDLLGRHDAAEVAKQVLARF